MITAARAVVVAFVLLAASVAFDAAALVAADGKTVEPFNGKDLSGWKTKEPESRSQWKVGTAKLADGHPDAIAFSDGGNELVNVSGKGVDAYTEAKFGDVRIEVEVMVPKGSNSGIYVHGEYEVQVFDSYGKKELGGGDMGAIYGASPPKVNASRAPGEWQKYVIEFRAPKFDEDGKKTANAKFVKVVLNGKTLHENVEMKGPTPSGVTGNEAAEGPIMFQGDHGPVAYRNLKITALE
ncbi:MAG: DUF1080 domain-containing protein [Pirellulales bacterium]